MSEFEWEWQMGATATVSGNRDLATKSAKALRELIVTRWNSSHPATERYPWLWESDRWQELVFCLIARLGAPDLAPSAARAATEVLSRLDLVDISVLAHVSDSGDDRGKPSREAALITEVLTRLGATPSRAQATLTTLVEAAQAIDKHHGGKVQHYLRLYGQTMLDELGKTFSFTKATEPELRQAFTHWLQNVLNMPLPLSNPDVERACKVHGFTVDELVVAADELDLNLALVDDLLAGGEDEAGATVASGEPRAQILR